MKQTGISGETFEQAVRLDLLPMLENGAIDFSRGWVGISDYIERAEGNSSYVSRIARVQDEIRRRISGFHGSISSREESSPILEASHQEWWAREGFFSEEAARAFKKAEANGQVRIFSRK